MKIHRLTLGPLSANCYVIETSSKNAAAVDIGGDYPRLRILLKKEGLTLKKILLTHGHYDHFGGVADAVTDTGAEVYIHKNDAHMLTSRRDSLSEAVSFGSFVPIKEFNVLKDGDKITLDELTFDVISTPGHTKGGVCYRCGEVIFTGDTLFALSHGRTDFPGGSPAEMHSSLMKLAAIKEDLKVCPGHNETSGLDFEKRNNPFMKENPYEDLI